MNITSWLQYDFMRNALIAVLIITPLFGIMGTMIVNKKMAYFSDALGHWQQHQHMDQCYIHFGISCKPSGNHLEIKLINIIVDYKLLI